MLNFFLFGLGNPGEAYAGSWHNTGFVVVDTIARKFQAQWQKKDRFQAEIAESQQLGIMLAKPQTFMNESGQAVQSILHFYAKEELQEALQQTYVVYDDLDLPLGSYKMQFGKHPRIHNGVNSIVSCLGTSEFWHVRIGTETRVTPEERNIPGEKYVLMKPRVEQQLELEKVIENVIQELSGIIL